MQYDNMCKAALIPPAMKMPSWLNTRHFPLKKIEEKKKKKSDAMCLILKTHFLPVQHFRQQRAVSAVDICSAKCLHLQEAKEEISPILQDSRDLQMLECLRPVTCFSESFGLTCWLRTWDARNLQQPS